MQLTNYSIVLEQLTSATIELVRQWRNSPSVSKYMEYKTIISEEQQRIWFDQIDPTKEFYFIIKKDNVPFGMIHLNHINWELNCGEVGLFIGEPEFLGTGSTFAASLALLDFAFEKIQLNEVRAKINTNNTEAIRYNTFLGFIPTDTTTTDFTLWKLTKEAYTRSKEKIIRLLP